MAPQGEIFSRMTKRWLLLLLLYFGLLELTAVLVTTDDSKHSIRLFQPFLPVHCQNNNVLTYLCIIMLCFVRILHNHDWNLFDELISSCKSCKSPTVVMNSDRESDKFSAQSWYSLLDNNTTTTQVHLNTPHNWQTSQSKYNTVNVDKWTFFYFRWRRGLKICLIQ